MLWGRMCSETWREWSWFHVCMNGKWVPGKEKRTDKDPETVIVWRTHKAVVWPRWCGKKKKEIKDQLRGLLMRVKEESEKACWKRNIDKTKIMASNSITSLQIDGGEVETAADFIFLGSKTAADVDCSHEIKRCLFLGRKVMINLDSILKSRDITLPTKVCLVKTMVFPVVMYGCENWTVKKAECWRIDAFELRCWRRLLGVPWTARRYK